MLVNWCCCVGDVGIGTHALCKCAAVLAMGLFDWLIDCLFGMEKGLGGRESAIGMANGMTSGPDCTLAPRLGHALRSQDVWGSWILDFVLGMFGGGEWEGIEMLGWGVVSIVVVTMLLAVNVLVLGLSRRRAAKKCVKIVEAELELGSELISRKSE